MRSIWEYYATWFHYESTTELYPVPVREIYAEVAELAGVEALAASARRALAIDEPVRALHFCEMALAANPESRVALEAQKEALNWLLDRATKNFETTYEIIWLETELRKTEESLSSS